MPSKLVARNIRDHPMARKMRAWTRNVQNFANRPLVLRLRYMDIVTAIAVLFGACNYMFLMAEYRASLVNVLKLDFYWETAFRAIIMYFIVNIFGNFYMNSKSFFLLRKHQTRPSEFWFPETKWQVLRSCMGMAHKRHSVLIFFHTAMLATFISFCTYWYLTVKVENFSLFNELLRYIFKDDYLYESFVFYPERKTEPYVLWFCSAVFLIMIAVAMTCTKMYSNITNEKISGDGLKSYIPFLFGTKWWWAILWPFAVSPEAKTEDLKDS